jgi:type IV secretion/conjugal transfer VirB4 family ATPase
MFSRYAKQVNQERNVAPFIPYISHITPDTIITKDGDYVRIWKVAGIAFETSEADDIVRHKDQLNMLLRSIASDHVAVWTHQVRRRTTDRLAANFENDFCRNLDKKYYDNFNNYKMMANELYLTVVYRPTPSRVERSLIKSARRTTDQIKADNKKALKKLDDIAYQVEAGLRRYGADNVRGIEALTAYEIAGVKCSKMLEFLNFLVSGDWQRVRIPAAPLNEYIGTSWLFVGAETIEIRSPTRTRFAQCIDFKDYASHTEPGILNNLMLEDYEYVITQSFTFMTKRDGKAFLERQQRQLSNAEDGSVSQIEQMSWALDQLIQGEFVMGEYHYSLMVFGDTVEHVRRNTTSAMTVIQDLGFLAAIVGTATDAAFYAQLPCNWSYRPRVAGLTSRNFAGLCSLHNFRAGKRDNNPWGQAVSLFKTESGQPLYFNYHFSRGDEDAYDKKVLGNTRVIGQSGSGKTVLLNFLLCQSQKFKTNAPNGYTDVFFDKDRGAELLIRAIGGKYLAIRNGQPTGFNPFAGLPSTESNLLFLEKLVRVLASDNGQKPISSNDEARISKAVRSVMKMPSHMRRLSYVLQNMTEGFDLAERENSLVKRLGKWCVDDGTGKRGALSWVLDNPNDLIDFTTHTSYGFDGTDFLDNEDVRTPISMYLLHRMDTVIDGRRFIYFMDEAWKWVDDEAFAEFAGNKQLTIRKQNGLGVFATQMPSSLLRSKIASSLVQQVATEIYLPNPKADFVEYTEGFKLTPTEFRIIKDMGEESRKFLIKQGQQSMIGRLDLNGFDDELAILSGSSDNVELLDEIIAEHGDNPDVWLPIFHQRRKERVLKSRAA